MQERNSETKRNNNLSGILLGLEEIPVDDGSSGDGDDGDDDEDGMRTERSSEEEARGARVRVGGRLSLSSAGAKKRARRPDGVAAAEKFSAD